MCVSIALVGCKRQISMLCLTPSLALPLTLSLSLHLVLVHTSWIALPPCASYPIVLTAFRTIEIVYEIKRKGRERGRVGKYHVCVSPPYVCGPESIFLVAQQIQMYIRRFAFFRFSTDRLKQQTHTRTHSYTHTLWRKH